MNIVYVNSLSNKKIFVLDNWKSLKITNDKTNEIWIKSLLNAELIILRSEKIPRSKMRKENNINESISLLKKERKLRNKKIPPVKGTFSFDANFWCLSPVSLTKKLLKHAKIKNNMLFVGQGKTFQIWEPTIFEKFKVIARKKASLSRASLKWEH